ncbi:MAG TPA: MFS transporter [Propionibacteriaceae bacterium]|nr:MFS transporter [Propionibacteriaceae bacterium]
MGPFTGNRSAVAVALVCLAQFVIVLDVTVVTSALPALGRELGFGAEDLQWVVTAYVLAFGGFLVAGGRAADLVGARRAFTVGLAGFAAASLGCGLAPTGWVLIVSRVGQGLAAALLTPAALALLNAVTQPGAARRRAVGIWTAAAAGGGASGWVLGGLLTEYAGWRWVFLINVPIGVVGLSLVALVLPRVTPEADRRLDLLGAVGLTAGLSLAVYGLSEAAVSGPDLLLVAGTLLSGALLIAGTLAYERRVAAPLLPPGLLGAPAVRGANLLAAAVTASTSPAMFVAVLYVQDVLAMSPGRAAWLFPALNLTVIAGSLAGPNLMARLGPRRTAVGGLVLIGMGSLLLTTVPPTGLPVFRLLSAFAVMGLGLGVASVASTSVGTAAAEPADRGVAGGVLNSAAQLGTALGVALLVPLATRTGDGPEGIYAGLWLGWVGAAVIAALGIGAAVRLPVREQPPAGETAPGTPMSSTAAPGH